MSVRLLSDKAHGHEHGHEHSHSKMELPDYKQWKIEGTPLEIVQEKLAARGLRDPWAHNEAWRYMRGFANNVSFVGAILKGFKWGFAAFVVAVGAEYYLGSQNKDNKHH
ncbi:NADH dehydrogenase [ubiquinone] 1 beta subcomplex subunit 3-like [Phyllostomus discolor]|uniref:NADH dehydrogenase [ubiquinone] 1 beta subcomplex subunit 3 n=1 Tax=Phyllostomus discolor TaxID=89673 RepID=A0A7E6E7Y1_9CHIR|nr:NADH dehydrogenase [ubiquinone] 1 beta subcomplex subunit 3-like [Phyllostomus discolor]